MFAHFSFACLVSTMRHVAAHPTHTNDMMARDTTRILVHATLDEAHTFLALKIDCFFSTVFLIGPYIIIQYTVKTLHSFKDRTALGSKWCYVYPHICVQRILWWQLQRAILLCCRQKCDFIHILAFFRRPCFTHVLCLHARFPTRTSACSAVQTLNRTICVLGKRVFHAFSQGGPLLNTGCTPTPKLDGPTFVEAHFLCA